MVENKGDRIIEKTETQLSVIRYQLTIGRERILISDIEEATAETSYTKERSLCLAFYTIRQRRINCIIVVSSLCQGEVYESHGYPMQ